MENIYNQHNTSEYGIKEKLQKVKNKTSPTRIIEKYSIRSSIHIEKATNVVFQYNARENYSKKVVFADEINELLNDSTIASSIYLEELNKRSLAYEKWTKQKLQSKVITHLSAVINLRRIHTIKNLMPILEYLESSLDTKVLQVAIHRDEGKLINKKTKEKLVSGIDFFLNYNNKKLYYNKGYTEKINEDMYEKEKNYHAHIEFVGIDSKGNAIKRNYLNKLYLSNLQTFVDKSLKIKRGKNFYQNKNVKPQKIIDEGEMKRIANNKKTIESKNRILVKKIKNNATKEIALLKKDLHRVKKDCFALIEEKQQKEKIHNDEISKYVVNIQLLETLNKERIHKAKEKEKHVSELKKIISEKEQKIEELELKNNKYESTLRNWEEDRRREKDIQTKEFIGHSDIKTTMRYIRPKD